MGNTKCVVRPLPIPFIINLYYNIPLLYTLRYKLRVRPQSTNLPENDVLFYPVRSVGTPMCVFKFFLLLWHFIIQLTKHIIVNDFPERYDWYVPKILTKKKNTSHVYGDTCRIIFLLLFIIIIAATIIVGRNECITTILSYPIEITYTFVGRCVYMWDRWRW